MNESSLSEIEKIQLIETRKEISELKNLARKTNLSTKEKIEFRSNILGIQDNYKSINSSKKLTFIESAYAEDQSIVNMNSIQTNINNLSQATDYVPWWIILLVSLAIGS